jgi:murein DD-endopeptidase MepM/ murein hydrolase activator NlpD
MNYESHIVLLPEFADWTYYEALRSFIETYRVTVTKSADDGGSFSGTKHTATILQAPEAWPSGIVKFFQQRYPQVRLDPITFTTLTQLKQVLARRINASGLPQGRFTGAKFIEPVGPRPANPFQYDSHIVLMPNGSAWSWYQAAKEYLLNFRVTVTQSADDAGSFRGRGHTITCVNYPGAWSGGDIRAYLRANYPTANLDVVQVENAAALTKLFGYRIAVNDRFANPSTPPIPGNILRLQWPLPQEILPPRFSSLSQLFADRPWVYRAIGPALLGHEGLDFLAPLGTPVLAGADGAAIEVVRDLNVPNARGYGQFVKLRHTLSSGESYDTMYAHLSRVDVALNQTVGAGQQLGLSGESGNASGPHLHLGLERSNKLGAAFAERYLDPLLHLEMERTAQPIETAPSIYGTHEDYEGPDLEKRAGYVMQQQGVRGHILWTEGIGSDPTDMRGIDYARRTTGDHTVIVRLNNDYGNSGTVPTTERYAAFAQRCANFVRNSRGASIYVIGNEMNNLREWPLGQAIYAQEYARCFNLVYAAIKQVQPNAIVCPGAVDPYNATLGFAPYNSPQGDIRIYWQTMLNAINQCDGLAVHAYTRGPDPQLVDSPATFGNAPLLGVHLNFRCFEDVLNATPARFRNLPVYLTETNHLFPVNESQFGWLDDNRGWAWKMYQAVNAWNAAGNQQIHAALLYRWPQMDDWAIVNKPRVIEDFRQAVGLNYKPYKFS